MTRIRLTEMMLLCFIGVFALLSMLFAVIVFVTLWTGDMCDFLLYISGMAGSAICGYLWLKAFKEL